MINEKLVRSNFQLLKMSGGGTSADILKELADYAVENGLAKEGYYDALMAREKQFPTGLQATCGVAIPHADEEFTEQSTIVLAVLDNEAKFQQMGGQGTVDVEVIFLLLVKGLDKQVKILQNIVYLIQNEEILNLLKGPDALRIMEENFGSLV